VSISNSLNGSKLLMGDDAPEFVAKTSGWSRFSILLL